VLDAFVGRFSPSFYADLARARSNELKQKREQAETQAREDRLLAEERDRKEKERLAAIKTPDAGIDLPPTGSGNWLVILGSWPKSQKSKATQRLSYLKRKGIKARIIDTGDYPNLAGGLYAVVVGPYDKPLAERTLSSLAGAVADAYIKSGY
jgi:SPOR domain